MIQAVTTSSATDFKKLLKNVFILVSSLCAFFLSIQLMSAGSASLGQEFANSIITVTSNPFIGLFIGLLTTAILQSSSTTTTMAVTLVAAGSVSLEQAIPMIIGANIGTTLTSTLVSLSYITRTNEFRKAISAGVCHDLYNILLAIIILPLELKYKLLSTVSRDISSALPVLYAEHSMFNGLSRLFSPINEVLVQNLGGIITFILALILLFTTVKVISNLLYNRWIGNAKDQADSAFFGNKYKTFGLGLLITSVIQSSSLTTSLMVPLAATGKIKIHRAFQFILGANLGTTITAILAALFKSEAAMSLAIAHFIFNLTGTVLFLNIPILSRFTTLMSDKMGFLTLRNRIFGLMYILFTFFIIPFGLIYFSSNHKEVKNSVEVSTTIPQNETKPLED